MECAFVRSGVGSVKESETENAQEVTHKISEIQSFLKRQYLEERRPAALARYLVLDRKMPLPEAIFLLMDTFQLALSDLSCLNGWWHDGSGELSDEQINAFINAAIEKQH